MHDLIWRWSCFQALSVSELYDILRARSAVFIVEQNCPYQDIDRYDREAMHLVAWSGTEVAAYLRVLGPAVKFAEPSIGRVLTALSHRGTGLGRELFGRGVRYAEQHYPGHSIRIGAQAHLQGFYGSFGFAKSSEIYMEDGVPHMEMVREVTR